MPNSQPARLIVNQIARTASVRTTTEIRIQVRRLIAEIRLASMLNRESLERLISVLRWAGWQQRAKLALSRQAPLQTTGRPVDGSGDGDLKIIGDFLDHDIAHPG